MIKIFDTDEILFNVKDSRLKLSEITRRLSDLVLEYGYKKRTLAIEEIKDLENFEIFLIDLFLWDKYREIVAGSSRDLTIFCPGENFLRSFLIGAMLDNVAMEANCDCFEFKKNIEYIFESLRKGLEINENVAMFYSECFDQINQKCEVREKFLESLKQAVFD